MSEEEAMSGMNFVFLQDPMVWLELCAVLCTLGYLVKLLVMGVKVEEESDAVALNFYVTPKWKIELERLLQFGSFVTINKPSLSGQKV